MEMKTTVGPALVLALGALVAAPAAATAQEDEPGGEQTAERERVRTLTIRGDGPLALPAGPRGWLGVRVDDVDRAAADSLGLEEVRGARVLGVSDDSPAAAAGLREGDVIVGFDGEAVRSVAELVRRVRETPPGREVELRAVRDGSPRSIAVTIREGEGGFALRGMPGMRHLELHGPDDLPEGLSEERMERVRERMERAGQRWEEAMERLHERTGDLDSLRGSGTFRFRVDGRPRLGVQLESLTDQLAEYFGVGEDGGVLVSSVREDSPASEAGLRAGDVIVSFGDERVSDVGDLVGAVRGADAGPTTITVVRRGEERSVTVELPEREERDRAGPSSSRGAPGVRAAAPPGVRPVPAPASPPAGAPAAGARGLPLPAPVPPTPPGGGTIIL